MGAKPRPTGRVDGEWRNWQQRVLGETEWRYTCRVLGPTPRDRGSGAVGGTRNLPFIRALGDSDASSPILAFGIHEAR